MMTTSTPNLGDAIVLIDDDPSFGMIMRQLAQQWGVQLDYFPSLADLGYVALLGKYKVAILDYDLGSMTGSEINDYIRAFFAEMPTLIVSGSLRKARNSDKKGAVERPFIHKERGYEAILMTALGLAKSPNFPDLSSKYIELGVV